MKTKIGEKGQIVIPKPLRKSLGLRTGQELDLEEREGLIIVRPISPSDPIERLVGLVKEPVDVDEYLVSTRGPGERDSPGNEENQ